MQNSGFAGFSFSIPTSSSQAPPPSASQPSFGQRSALPFNTLSNNGTTSHPSTFIEQPPAFSQSSNFAQQSSTFQQPSNSVFAHSTTGVSFFQPTVASFGQTTAPTFGQTSGSIVTTRQSVSSGFNGRLGGDNINAGQGVLFGQPSSQAGLSGSLFTAPSSQGFSHLRMSTNNPIGANNSPEQSRQIGTVNDSRLNFTSHTRNNFFQSSMGTTSQGPSTRIGQSDNVNFKQPGILNFGQHFDENKQIMPNTTLQTFVVSNEQLAPNKGSDNPPTSSAFMRSNNLPEPFVVTAEGFKSSAHFDVEASSSQDSSSRPRPVASRGLGAMPFSFSRPDEHKSHHLSEAFERKGSEATNTATFLFTNPSMSNVSKGSTSFMLTHPESTLFGSKNQEEKSTELPLPEVRFVEENVSKAEKYAEPFPPSDRESDSETFGASKDRMVEERERHLQQEKSDKPLLKRTGRMPQRGNLFSRALQDACEGSKRDRRSNRTLHYGDRDMTCVDKSEHPTSREHVEAHGTKRGARKHHDDKRSSVDEDKPLRHLRPERDVTKMRSRDPKQNRMNTMDSSPGFGSSTMQMASLAKNIKICTSNVSSARKFQVEKITKDLIPSRHDDAEESKKRRTEASQRRMRRGSLKNLLIKKVISESPTSSKVVSPPSPSSELCAIVCKHIPPEHNTRDAIRTWAGKVRRISCHPQKQQAVLHFEDHASASAALRKGWKVGGKEISLFWYRRRSGSISKSPMEPNKDIEAGFRQILAPLSQAEEASGKVEDSSGIAPSTHLASRQLAKTRSPSKRTEPPRDTESVELPLKVARGGAASKEELTSVPFAHLKGSTAGNSEEKYQLLELRDKQMRQARTRRTELEKARAIVGTCLDMCPEKERYLREIRKQLSIYEVIPGTDKVNHTAVIKEYSRSSADQEEPLPHELRPPHVLNMTMQYLVSSVMHVGEDNWAEWYDFVWNRTRGIRKDITQQHLCEPISVSLIEKCTRFHVLCAHHLCQQPMATFEPKINNENLTKCLQSLKEMYQDLANKGMYCPGEPEFRGYSVLLNLNHGDILREVQQFREEIRNSSPVKFAVQVFSALNSNNFVRFFKLVQSASYLNACLLHRYFTQVRRDALKALNVAYTVPQRSASFPLQEMMRMLLFVSEQEAAEFFSHYGLNVTDETVELNRASFIEPECTLAMRKSSFIEGKLIMSLGEVVNGGPVGGTPRHIPSSSFDSQGRYTGDLSAEDSKDTAVFVKPTERDIVLLEDIEVTFAPAGCDSKRAAATLQFAPAERAVSLGSTAASVHKATAPVESAPVASLATRAPSPSELQPPEDVSAHAPLVPQDTPDAASFPAFSVQPTHPCESPESPPLPGDEGGTTAKVYLDGTAPGPALAPCKLPVLPVPQLSVTTVGSTRAPVAVSSPPSLPAPPPTAVPAALPTSLPTAASAPPPTAPVLLIDDELVESVWWELRQEALAELTTELALEVVRCLNLTYGCVEGISTALIDDVTLEAVRELAKSCISEEERNVLQERLRAEVREHSELVTCHELTNEVVSSLISEIAATQLRLAEEQMLREQVSRCCDEVGTVLLEQILTEEVSKIVAQLQSEARERARRLTAAAAAVSLSRTRQYFHRWSLRLAAKKRLRRSMLTFPAAPAYCASVFHHSHFLQTERSGGSEPCQHIDTSSLFTLRNAVTHQINVQSIYQRLLGNAVWSPLDLAQLLVASLLSPQLSLYWKLLLLLPPSRARSKQDRLLCRWLKIKFQRGNMDNSNRVVEIEEEEFLKTLSLYTVYCPPGRTSASSCNTANGVEALSLEQEELGYNLRSAVEVHVCVRLMERSLSAVEAEKVEESRVLLGTSGVLLLLPEPEAGRGLHHGLTVPSTTAHARPCAAPDEEYWASGRLQLAQVLERGPRWPPVPVAVLVPHAAAHTLDIKLVEYGLNLKELVSSGRISDYSVVHMAEDATFLKTDRALKEAVRWLMSRCPPPPALCCDSMRGFLEEGICREFGSRFYPDQATRRRTQVEPQAAQAIVELYNSVIRHMAAVASSTDLAALSWPPAEFSRGSRAEALPPHLHWNSERHLRWLKSVLLQFQLPPPPHDADWLTINEALEKYVPCVASVESRPVLSSNLARILKKASARQGAEWGTCGKEENEEDVKEEEWRRVRVLPWDELLECCIEHKLSECFLEMKHIPPDTLSEDGDLLVYYLPRGETFQPSAAWMDAEEATLQAARSQRDVSHGQPRRGQHTQVTVVDAAVALLPESLTAELQKALLCEREANASFAQQLSTWLHSPTDMPASCTPTTPALLQEEWEVDVGDPLVEGEAWARDPTESVSREISRLRRQIRAGNTADRYYELYLRGLLEIDV